MLSVWWDFKGIVYFELLPRNKTINSNVYCLQLMKLDKEIMEKRRERATRKGVIFHQNNDRPHTSLVTRKKLLELGWEVMPHPPYTRKTLYCQGGNIREVARLCCRCQHFIDYKMLCRCQSDTLRCDRDTLHKDLSYKN